MTILGIDIGGTKSAVVLAREDGSIIAREQFPTRPAEGVKAFMARLREAALELRTGRQLPSCISIAVGGPLDEGRGLLIGPPHLTGWSNVPLAELFGDYFTLPVYMMHDARAGAWAEWLFGAGRRPGVRSLAFMTFATGFGMGIVHEGRLLDIPGEIGHWRVAESGPELFGKSGSLEGLASGAGIAAMARESDQFAPGVTAAVLAGAAREGNAVARKIFHDVAVQVGRQCARLIDLFGLDVIALGTIAVHCEDLLLEDIRNVAREEALPHLAEKCEIIPARLGTDLGDMACLSAALHAGWRNDARLGPRSQQQLRGLADLCLKAYSDIELLGAIDQAARVVVESLDNGGKILTCGNGGSAADAEHLAEELIGRYRGDRKSLSAVSLVADGPTLTCIANDYGFEDIFARQVAGIGRAGDVLVGFTTSGNSANINRAFARAKEMGITTVAVTGKDGGESLKIADHVILIPSNDTARIQELHTFVLHAMCEAAEHWFR